MQGGVAKEDLGKENVEALTRGCKNLDRLPRVVRVVRNPKITLDDNLEKTLGLVERWKRKGELETLAATYREAMTDAFARPRVTENAGTLHLYAEKGVISRFGVVITSYSIHYTKLYEPNA